MPLSTPNGCVCHVLNQGQVCLSCRAREIASKAGMTCDVCRVGLLPRELEKSICTDCQENGEEQ